MNKESIFKGKRFVNDENGGIKEVGAEQIRKKELPEKLKLNYLKKITFTAISGMIVGTGAVAGGTYSLIEKTGNNDLSTISIIGGVVLSMSSMQTLRNIEDKLKEVEDINNSKTRQ